MAAGSWLEIIELIEVLMAGGCLYIRMGVENVATALRGVKRIGSWGRIRHGARYWKIVAIAPRVS
jgi:hypothetical protein